jgi:hypothetical protein
MVAEHRPPRSQARTLHHRSLSMFILSVSLPGARHAVRTRLLSVASAVGVIRAFAAKHGVSPLALDWSVIRAEG